MMNYADVTAENWLTYVEQFENNYEDATIDQVIDFVNLRALHDVTDSLWVRIDKRKVRAVYIARHSLSGYRNDLGQSVRFGNYPYGTPYQFAKLWPAVMTTVSISDGGVEDATRKAWAEFVEKSER